MMLLYLAQLIQNILTYEPLSINLDIYIGTYQTSTDTVYVFFYTKILPYGIV